MVGSNETFVSMFVAANGVGKSATGANIVTNIVYGIQNEWFNLPLFQKFPYLKRGRIISDPTTLKEKIIPELEKWFPKDSISDTNFEMTKEGKSYFRKIKLNNGWEIDLMSNEQDTKEFESVDLGFVWIDEPMPKDKFLATIARGRLGMIIFWTFTPLNYSAWIKDWMDEHADGQYADYVEAELEDNCKAHGVRGILDHVNIKRISDAYPEDELLARVFGKFGHLIGRVHKKFKRKIHIVKPFKIDPKRFTLYHALDPHPRVPDHAMWLAVDKNGTKFVCGEMLATGTSAELAERIKAFEEKMGYGRVEQRIIDPSGYIDDQHNEKPSIGSQLFEKGLHYVKGSKDLMAGIKRTDEALDYEMKGNEFIRAPEVYFFDTCPITIKQIDEYVWDEWHGRGADEKQPKARPKDKNDHQVENLHRLLLTNPQYVHYSQRNAGMPFSQTSEEDELDPY